MRKKIENRRNFDPRCGKLTSLLSVTNVSVNSMKTTEKLFWFGIAFSFLFSVFWLWPEKTRKKNTLCQ